MKLILASSSHNRQELLKIAGIPYLLDPANIDESIFLESDPKKMTQSIALAKAQAVAKNHSNSLIIAGDTVAVYRNKIMGKPKFKMDALAVLKSLSGTSHEIVSGWAVINSKTKTTHQGVSVTRVFFRRLSEKEILDYVNDHQVTRYAAGYTPLNSSAIGFIEKIEGSLTGFSHGLPLEQVLPIISEAI